MLRRFRKRRDGQQGGENYGLYSDTDQEEGMTMSMPLKEEHVRGHTIQQPQHLQLQQNHQHLQLPQPKFKHVLMAGEGQHREKSIISEGRKGNSKQNRTSVGRVAGRNNEDRSSTQARVVTPSKEPPISPPRNTPKTSINVSPLQERSRQKLDILSRQHQKYQCQNNYHQFAASTPPTSCSVTTDGTMDSSMQPLPECSRQQLLYPNNNYKNNNNYNSIVPPSSLTRRMVTCNDLFDGNSTMGASSLESSYYSKHDFHNLPRAFSFAESSNMSSALETSFDTPDSSNNNNNSKRGNHNGMLGSTPPINVRHHEYDYQPTPPQKRSGSEVYEKSSMKRISQTELARGRSCPSQLRQQQHHQNQQLPQEIDETSTTAAAIELKLRDVGSNNNNDDDGGGGLVVITPDPVIGGVITRAAGTDEKASSASKIQAEPISPSTTTSLTVTPSPPSKPHKRILNHNRPLHDPTKLSSSRDPPQQQGQTDTALNTIDASVSVASTAKISNTPHLISRLLMRHPMSKLRSLQQQNNEQSRPKQENCSTEEQKKGQSQPQRQPKSEIERDPTKDAPKGILKSPPLVSRELAEPPEELPSVQQTRIRRPDPPPDPPAECKQYVSKDSNSQHRAGELPSRHQKIQNKMQSETTSHPSIARQPQPFHSTLTTSSHLNSQKTSRNSQQRVHSELTTPVPFKKVNSTPSNFSSFFTVNSVSTSKFWDEIERYSDQKKGNRKILGKDHIARNDMVVMETDEYFNSHLVRVKKGRLLVKSAKNMKQIDDTARSEPAVSAMPLLKTSKPDAVIGKSSNDRVQSPLESIHEDESNAFSLKLPMHGNAGGFDDSDISALQMNDSATVYYQRQLHCDAEDVFDPNNYWKKKYDKLKEETIAVLGSGMIRAEGDEEHHQLQKNDVHDNGQGEGELAELAEIMDNNPMDTRRKEIDVTYGSLEDTADTTRRTDSTSIKESQRFASSLGSLNQLCDAVVNGAGCTHRKKHCQEVTVHSMKKTAETMLNFVTQIEKGNTDNKIARDYLNMNGLGSEIHACTSTCMPEIHDATQDVLPSMQQPENEVQARLVEAPREIAEPQVSKEFDMVDGTLPTLQHNAFQQMQMSFEIDDEYDGQNLRPLGFVPLERTGSALEDNFDVSILEQWNKSRAEKCSKSLADDLTAGVSRLSHGIISKESSFEEDGDQSELSENANLIFKAAIKNNMGFAPHAQRSGGSSTENNPSEFNPDSSRASSRMSSVAGRSGKSLAFITHCKSIIPSDFSSWFELPSPGSTCIPLLPLLSASLRISLDVIDASDASPLDRVDDVVSLSLADFLSHTSKRLAGDEFDLNIVKQSIGSIVVENGSVRFVNSAASLPEISHAAVLAISRRQFQDATEIYNCLLSACQNASGTKPSLIGQLVASTLHNLSVLYLWQQEYDLALPCCREALRMKKETEDDKGGLIDLWANLGLINYAIGSAASSLAAYRMAAQLSSKFFPDDQLMGRLMNNAAAVNFDIGTNMPLVQSQFKQALQMQKNGSSASSDEADESVENLLSISISTFNVGVTCAKQNQVEAAISYMTSCYAIQQTILDSNHKIVLSTAYYMGSLRKQVPGSALQKAGSSLEENQPILDRDESQHTLHDNRSVHPSRSYDDHNAMTEAKSRAHEDEPTKSVTPEIVAAAAGQNATSARGELSNSHPILCLGSLRVEATVSQRVHHSLEGCFDSLCRDSEPNLLLCRRSNISSKYKTMSHNLIQKGVQAIKKREAQSTLQKNLERYGPRHPEVGKSHHNVGLLCLLTVHYQEAVTHLEHAVRIYTNTIGMTHPDVASTLMLKGLAQLALERFEDSMASMYRVRHSREHILGRQHPELGLILNNMACVQYELHDYKNSEALFQEALDLQREIFSTEPTFLKQVSIVLSNIAFLHAKSGSFPKALIELEGALQIRQDILFEDNESVSDILQNMAHILAIHQLQHGAVNLDEMTEEYITMLKK